MANKNNDNKATDKLIADSTTNSEDFTRDMASKLEEAESKFKEIPLPDSDAERLSSGVKESLSKNTPFINATENTVDNISAQNLTDNSKNEGFNAAIDAIIKGGSAESSVDEVSGENKRLSGRAEGLADNVGGTHQETIDAIIRRGAAESSVGMASGESKDSSDTAEGVADPIGSTHQSSAVEMLNPNDSSQVLDDVPEKPESTSGFVANSVPAIDLSFKKNTVGAEITKIEKEPVPENSLGLASEIKAQPTEGETTGLLEQQVDNTLQEQEHISDYPDKGDNSDDPILGAYEDKYLDLPAGSVVEKSGFPWVLLIGILAIIWATVWRFNFFEPEKLDVAGDEFNVAESLVEESGNTGLASLNKNTDGISIPLSTIEIETEVGKQSKETSSTSELVSPNTRAVTTDRLVKTSGEVDKNSIVIGAIEKTGEGQVSVANAGVNVTQEAVTGNAVIAIRTFLESDDKSQSKGFILYGLNFNSASSRISSGSAKVVADLATVMQTYPNLKIRLEGHTDSQGNPEKNKLLSSYRAKAVKVRLVSLNVSPERILTEGLGQEFPITDNGTRAGRKKNRRVEVIIER